MHHDMLILEHPEKNKRKRRICPCGCRKKETHIQFCNGVAMNGGCIEYLEKEVSKIKKQKDLVQKRRKNLYKKVGLTEGQMNTN